MKLFGKLKAYTPLSMHDTKPGVKNGDSTIGMCISMLLNLDSSGLIYYRRWLQ